LVDLCGDLAFSHSQLLLSDSGVSPQRLDDLDRGVD